MGSDRQHGALVVTCIFPALCAVFVGLRSFSRYLGRNFGWDDGLICVSLALLIGETICVYQFIVLGWTGYRKDERPVLTPSEQVTVMKWSFALQLFYHPLMGAIRASIIMFLYRVQDVRPFIRIALHTVFWINIGYMVSTTLVNIFQCSPMRYAYMAPIMNQPVDGKVEKHGKCINSLAFILASCGLSIFMDLIIIPIPTVMVWNLQLRRRLKIAVVIIMSMGWIATAVSVARFIIYYNRFSPSQKDRTYNIGIIVSIIEPSVAIIAACAPALKSLISRLLPRFLSHDDADYYSTTSSHTTRRPSHSNHSSNHHQNSKDAQSQDSRVNRINDEGRYGMRRLGSVDSQEDMVGMGVSEPRKTRSIKTCTTAFNDSDEDVGRIPKHMLTTEN